ncbi:MAG: tRNA threonylcarbamoyladenosine dehydratase [Cocleimonas sp.]
MNKNNDEDKNLNHRFSGVESLYGKTSLERFTQAHIIVIGIGGVGSWVAEALARNAIGEITLIDMDVVAESNINRQLPALSSTIGKNKIDVMATRIQDINPNCSVNLIDDFISEDNLDELISSGANFVIDCIDNSRVKAALIASCKRRKIKIITVGGAGGQTDPSQIKVSDLSRTEHDPLLSKTRKLLRQNFGFSSNVKRRFAVPCVYSTEHLKRPQKNINAMALSCAGGLGSSVMVTASFGFIAVALVLKKLMNNNA